jgi:hypothetical protein
MERLTRRGPRSYKVQAVEQWILHNLECKIDGVPIFKLLEDRAALQALPAVRIAGWKTYKPALSESDFQKTCVRIHSSHDYIRHRESTFEVHYLIEELGKLQALQEDLEHEIVKKMDIVRCERCLRLEAMVRALKGQGTEHFDDAKDEAVYRHSCDYLDKNYTYERNGQLMRSLLMIQLNNSLRRTGLPMLNKLNDTWRKLMEDKLRNVQRPGYRPLRLRYTPKRSTTDTKKLQIKKPDVEAPTPSGIPDMPQPEDTDRSALHLATIGKS